MRSIAFLAVSCLGISAAFSQAPAVNSDSAEAQLRAIKAANQALIEKQQKTLLMLEELKAASEQLKSLGKRS